MAGTDPPNRSNSFSPDLLDRSYLMRRWQQGSEAFSWRCEKRGLLTPVSDGCKLRYTWSAVVDFEGGMPADGDTPYYVQDLMTPQQVAAVVTCAAARISRAVAMDELPVRRVSRQLRFVPIEVSRWLERGWTRCERKSPENKGGSA